MLTSEFRNELHSLRRELQLLQVKQKGIEAQIQAIQKLCTHENHMHLDRECRVCGSALIIPVTRQGGP